MSQLPPNWANATLGDVITGFEAGRNLRAASSPATATEFGVLKISAVSWGRFQPHENKALLPGDRPMARELVRKGDLLISRANTTELVGAPVLVDRDYENLMLPDKILRVKYNERIVDPRYLLYALRTAKARRYIEEQATGTSDSMRNLSQPKLSAIPIPVAPLAEQKRIADKLDRLLAAVDTCKARLDVIPQILKRFRRSVLAAATRGELTEDWRDFPEQLGQLPNSWFESTIGQVGKVQLGRQRSPRFHSGDNMRPYLRVQNVFEDRLDLADVMTMHFSDADFERYRLEPGDILLCEGQSPEYLGRPAMYKGEIEGACFTNTLIRFKASDRVRPAFALLVFRHHMHSRRYVAEGTITTNIAHLGAGRFANVEFPLPPLDEQDEIVGRASSLLTLAGEIQGKQERVRLHVDKMTRSLLEKAFGGNLVPHDASDESPHLALERTKAQRKAERNGISGKVTIRVPRPSAMITIKSTSPTIGERQMLKRSAVAYNHLSTLLTKAGPLSPEMLLRESQLDIDDFYDQLKEEEQRGLVREVRSGANHEKSLLESVS